MRKLILSTIFVVLLATILFLGKARSNNGQESAVYVLGYHRIDVVKNPKLAGTISPETFKRQMYWLVDNGYTAITQHQLYDALQKNSSLPKKSVMITFDDGYADVMKYAVPTLEELGMSATMYLITSRVSSPNPEFMTWDMAREAEASGMEIGSHTAHHVRLSEVTPEVMAKELRDSKHVLEQKLGHRINWFSYPFGAIDPSVVKAVENAGYLTAVTTVPGNAGKQPLVLRRTFVNENDASFREIFG